MLQWAVYIIENPKKLTIIAVELLMVLKSVFSSVVQINAANSGTINFVQTELLVS